VRRFNLEHLVHHEFDSAASAPGVVDLFIFGFSSFFFLVRMELLDHRGSHRDSFSFLSLLHVFLIISGFVVLGPKRRHRYSFSLCFGVLGGEGKG
jgi:hypothetical protein